MKTEFAFITPNMLARGLVQIFIAFDDNGDLKPLSMATLFLAELRQNNEIRRTLNKEGHICFLFSPEEWAELYTIMGMSRSKWAETMEAIENEGYIVMSVNERGHYSMRFYLEISALH